MTIKYVLKPLRPGVKIERSRNCVCAIDTISRKTPTMKGALLRHRSVFLFIDTLSDHHSRVLGPTQDFSLQGLRGALQELKSNLDIDIRVLGIASSSRMLLSEEGIDLSSWKAQFARCARQRQTCTQQGTVCLTQARIPSGRGDMPVRQELTI